MVGPRVVKPVPTRAAHAGRAVGVHLKTRTAPRTATSTTAAATVLVVGNAVGNSAMATNDTTEDPTASGTHQEAGSQPMTMAAAATKPIMAATHKASPIALLTV